MPTLEEMNEERRKAEAALPRILSGLVRREEPASIASAVARDQEISEATAYGWVVPIEERFLTRRRRIAVLGNALLSPGVVLLIAGILVAVLTRGTTLGLVIAAVGLIAAVIAGILLSGSRRIAGHLERRRLMAG